MDKTQLGCPRPPASSEGIVIQDRFESKRGCGYRKPGGKYMVSGGLSMECGRLPIPLTYCPTCGAGIKFCRSWTWIDGDAIVATKPCVYQDDDRAHNCRECSLGHGKIGRVGLLWIGEKFYKRPQDFTDEAVRMGVSRRVPAIPKGFKVGKTLVLVAHKKAIENQCPDCAHETKAERDEYMADGRECATCKNTRHVYQPAIFHAFVPTRIEYVVSPDDDEEKLAGLVKAGFTLVRVHKVQEQAEIAFDRNSPDKVAQRLGKDEPVEKEAG